MQLVVHRSNGMVRQFIVDDKGCVLIVAFGLPTHAHKNDAERAINTAMEIRNSLRAMGSGINTSIGITSGRAFCGIVGSADRREYAVVGDVVNLAARLMTAHMCDVLCDQATFENTNSAWRFETLPNITVKGKSEPIPIHRPLYRNTENTKRGGLASSALNRHPVLGREQEKAKCLKSLLSYVHDNEPALLMIEGRAGLGKTAILQHVREIVSNVSLHLVQGNGYASEMTTPYFAFTSIFRQLLHIDSSAFENMDSERKKKALLQHLEILDREEWTAGSAIDRVRSDVINRIEPKAQPASNNSKNTHGKTRRRSSISNVNVAAEKESVSLHVRVEDSGKQYKNTEMKLHPKIEEGNESQTENDLDESGKSIDPFQVNEDFTFRSDKNKEKAYTSFRGNARRRSIGLKTNPEGIPFIDLAPLLLSILDLDIDLGSPAFSVVQRMSTSERAQQTKRLLSALLQKQGKLAIIMEDAHWLDSASWDFLLDVCRNLKLLVVISMRPISNDNGRLDSFFSLPHCTKITLPPLSNKDMGDMLSHLFHVKQWPEETLSAMMEFSRGNPLWCKEFAVSLIRKQYILLQDDMCIINPDKDFSSCLSTEDLSRGLHGLIAERIDGLTQSQQYVLKAASAIGTVFGTSILRKVRFFCFFPRYLL